jgi:hypothetical protein
MKHQNSLRILIVLLAVSGSQTVAQPAPEYAPQKSDAWIAANDPDRFAWILFSAISAPANNEHSRDLIWETWPEQKEIYADPTLAPKWPLNEHRAKQLSPSAQRARRAHEYNEKSPEGSLQEIRSSISNEEVRNNKAAFDYIINNDLWYKEGIVNKVRNGQIKLPYGAITVKGKWKVISESQKDRYHWHKYKDEKLVALHIASRILPNWHWSTFEHVDNPGLADYIGLHDSFGIRPMDIWPNREANQGYSEKFGKAKDNVGVLTDAASKLMQAQNLAYPLSHFYRLKGSQIAFTDRTGRSTVVGNSITEAGFVATSSCITCHARASVGAPYQGQNNYPVPDPLSIFTDRGESFNGPVDPNWFWDAGAAFSAPPAEPEAYRKSTEFLWQLSLMPKSRLPASDKNKSY